MLPLVLESSCSRKKRELRRPASGPAGEKGTVYVGQRTGREAFSVTWDGQDAITVELSPGVVGDVPSLLAVCWGYTTVPPGPWKARARANLPGVGKVLYGGVTFLGGKYKVGQGDRAGRWMELPRIFAEFRRPGAAALGGVIEIPPETLRPEKSLYRVKLGLKSAVDDLTFPIAVTAGLVPQYAYVIPNPLESKRGTFESLLESTKLHVKIRRPGVPGEKPEKPGRL